MGVEALLLGLFVALAVDALAGEPPLRLHPVVWVGKLASRLKRALNKGSPTGRRLKGLFTALALILTFTLPAALFTLTIGERLNPVLFALVLGLALKPTFALKSMQLHVEPVALALENGDLEEARRRVSLTVRRDASRLGEGHVASAAVETIAEGLVDGFASTLFFYALFGLPGAVFHRVVNTLDSMLGYKDPEHLDIGWFSAKLDTLVNYIPARLTALLIVAAAMLLRRDWKGAIKVLIVDRRKTESLNAGWPISAVAGALGVRLEKINHYLINEERSLPVAAHIREALRITRATAVLFLLFVVLPLLLTAGLLG